jgi:hypothetical protein
LLIASFFTLESSVAQQYVLSTLAGGSPPPTPAVATADSIFPPFGIAVDSTGNIFFTSVECVFRVIGNTLERIAGNSRKGYSGDGGPAINAQIGVGKVNSAPSGGLTIDSIGNVYIAESENSRIRMISSTGIITTVAGNGAISPSGDGGPAVNAALGIPVVVAVDGIGNLFIADSAFGLIRRVSPIGIISTVAGGGSAKVQDGAVATSISLSHPMGLVVDASGNLFLSDNGQNCIRKVSTSGIITTVAGIVQWDSRPYDIHFVRPSCSCRAVRDHGYCRADYR